MFSRILFLIVFGIGTQAIVLGQCPELYLFQTSAAGKSGYAVPKSGYLDATGKTVVEPKYFAADDMFEGLARVEVTGNGKQPRYGFINGCGKMVISPIFKGALNFSEGLAGVLTHKGWAFINRTGKIQFNLGFWESTTTPPLTNFSNGFALIYLSKGVRFIDKSGKLAFGKIFDDASEFYNGVAVVEKGGNFAVIDGKGKYIIKPQPQKILISPDGVTRIQGKDNLWTYFSKQGKKLFNHKNELNFSGELASFEIEGKYGYIDMNGKTVIPPKYEFAGDFEKGIAIVSLGQNQYGVIDKNGKLIIPSIYRHISIVDENVIGIVSQDKNCFSTLSGKIFGCF